jgi:hypothetical protein
LMDYMDEMDSDALLDWLPSASISSILSIGNTEDGSVNL